MSVYDFELSQVADILMIQRVLIRSGTYADQKKWDDLRSVFADEVTIDFGGVKPTQVINGDDLVAWSKKTNLLLQTQHMFTNQDIHVQGDRAISTGYGRALHRRTDNGDSWLIYNRYEHTLVRTQQGWKIERLLMEPTWQTGNVNLLDEALQAGENIEK